MSKFVLLSALLASLALSLTGTLVASETTNEFGWQDIVLLADFLGHVYKQLGIPIKQVEIAEPNTEKFTALISAVDKIDEDKLVAAIARFWTVMKEDEANGMIFATPEELGLDSIDHFVAKTFDTCRKSIDYAEAIGELDGNTYQAKSCECYVKHDQTKLIEMAKKAINL